MPMPETAMHKYNRLIFAEHDIRLAREIGTVQPKPETTGKEDLTDNHLRLRILRPDPAHIVAADFC